MSAFALDHAGQHRLNASQAPGEVDVERVNPFLFANFSDCPNRAWICRVVDQNVDAAELREHRIGPCGDRVGAGDIGHDGERYAAPSDDLLGNRIALASRPTHNNDAVAVFRAKGLPVLYSTNDYRSDGFDLGGWSLKASRMNEDLERGVDGNAIVDDIAPGDRDIVVYKQKPSAFRGTPLVDYLVKLGVDGVIFTGTTTSGCVRAAVIDAFSYNFRCTIVEDGCFDRSVASHAINFCDMNAKYGDVVGSDEVVAYANSLPDDLFQLPSGI